MKAHTSAEIIPFPRRCIPAPDRLSRAPDRLSRAMADLNAAMAEQKSAIAKWRSALAELSATTAEIGHGLCAFQTSLARLGSNVGAVNEDALATLDWAEAALAAPVAPDR